MKIYIVTYCPSEVEFYILGVFSSWKLAMEWKNKQDGTDFDYEIEELEVDEKV